jgi:mycothiol synthase
VKVRRPTAADLPAALEVARAAEIAVLGYSDWTEEELTEDWERADLERDVWLVELDGRLAGYAIVYERRGGQVVSDGYVHPELRNRGVGSELLRLLEDSARAEGAQLLHNATIVGGDPCAPNLYAARGYTPVRFFWRMVVELDAEPTVPHVPGIELRRPRHPDETRRVHEAIELAFADHWNHRPRSFDEWAGHHVERAGFDPTLWWVALDGDEIAGAAVCAWKRFGDWGWVSLLGVRPEWRRRGIAEALLQAAFAEFFRRGERTVALGVDSQSATGATRLYEKVGMSVRFEVVVYEKALT